jgi:AcrR family transcriptional regulator
MEARRRPDDDDATRREQEFTAWVKAGRLPEIKLGVQQRSLRTAFALLESGAHLLRERAFDALTIQDICAAAGATEGAFYGRFVDKTTYFAALQRLTSLRSESALRVFLEEARRAPASLEGLCQAVVEMTLRRYRDNLGIYRAALKHSDEGAWEPFRQLGDIYRQALTELLAPLLPHVPAQERPLRIRFAYQVMVGTLVHATLNDPGPLHLHEPRMARELAELLVRYLAADAAEPKRKGRA